jgi:hypothetical protein
MGTETLGLTVVEVEVVLVVVEVVLVVVKVVVVVVDVVDVGEVVVVVEAEPEFIVNPQPCEGSFSVSGSETGS